MTALDIALLLLRFAVLVAEAGLFGTLAVQWLDGSRIGDRLLAILFIALAVLLPAWLLVQSANMAGSVGIADTLAACWLVLQASWVGHLAIGRVVVWCITWMAWRRFGVAWALLPAGVALALHAGAGHAAATGDPWLFVSVLAHVFAASAWIGGLPALWLALDAPGASVLVARYTWLGLLCVIVVASTATVQALALAGGVPGLVGTDYGHVILAKIGLLLLLLLLAARHRFVLAPRLPASLATLRRSVLVEIALGLGVMAAASLLASLPPGAHSQPDWPFPWRFSLDLMDDDELRREVVNAAQAMGGAGLLLLLAILARRIRWLAVATALGIAWFAIPQFDLLLLPTEPTVYWQSTTGDTAASIDLGRRAYVQNCMGCHGEGGQGDGMQAKGMRIPPADLTAPHLWEHPDGELYWWIAHGMPGPDGKLVMPGFSPALDDETIWSLIDFLHSNNPNTPADGVPLGMHMHH